MSLLEQFEFIDDRGEFGQPENANMLVDKEQGNLSPREKDAQR